MRSNFINWVWRRLLRAFLEIHHFNMATGRVCLRSRICCFFFTCSNLGVPFVSWSGRAFVAPTGSVQSVWMRWSVPSRRPWLVSALTGFPLLFSPPGVQHSGLPPGMISLLLSVRLLFSSLFENNFFCSPSLTSLASYAPESRAAGLHPLPVGGESSPLPVLLGPRTLCWLGLVLGWHWVDRLSLLAGEQDPRSLC